MLNDEEKRKVSLALSSIDGSDKSVGDVLNKVDNGYIV